MIWILFTMRRFGAFLGKVLLVVAMVGLAAVMMTFDACAGLIGGP